MSALYYQNFSFLFFFSPGPMIMTEEEAGPPGPMNLDEEEAAGIGQIHG